ncbi:MAG: type III pantothenate kinase [Verrucomicrobiota bacterium]|jgi:type III pantothenate kinase|nr:type III pantothenate kinase [Verrucomicrobiota bacterium]
MTILAVNIGNSQTALGWFAHGSIRRSLRTVSASEEALAAVAGARKLDGICVCSVAASKNAAWKRMLKKACPGIPTLWMTPELDFGMDLDLKNPGQTGLDRYADAVAGANLCGVPCIVCDFGTATTFNLVLPEKGFSGGVIAPGYGMWFAAMHQGTAALPLLHPGGVKAATGRNTEEAMRLSARWGYRGMITEILWQLSKACGKTDPYLVATGGYAKQILKDAGLKMAVLPDLTLHGIALIFERNRHMVA